MLNITERRRFITKSGELDALEKELLRQLRDPKTRRALLERLAKSGELSAFLQAKSGTNG